MAKGQTRPNREVRKPKKTAAQRSTVSEGTVQATFAKVPPKSGKGKK